MPASAASVSRCAVGGDAPGTMAERLATTRNRNSVPMRGTKGPGSRRTTWRIWLSIDSTTSSSALCHLPGRTRMRRVPSQQGITIAAIKTQVVTTMRAIGTGPRWNSTCVTSGPLCITRLLAGARRR